MKQVRHTTLRFKQGASDKVYEVELVEIAALYLVHFSYGRFGATLREGSKTKTPISLKEATAIANSLLVSKIKKGYCVTQGYDPINKIILDKTVAPKAVTTSTMKIQERDQAIVHRLEEFSQSPQPLIQGYALGRTIWKAGELRIKAAQPAIEKILTSSEVKKEALTYYSILWTLGRIGDQKTLVLVDKIANKLPKKTEYMLMEVKMALSSNPQSLLPEIDEKRLAQCLKVDSLSQLHQEERKHRYFQETVLGLYWASLVDTSLRETLLTLVKNISVKDPFTLTFRRVYKIAEFRDDAQVLALLNHNVETSLPSKSNAWSNRKKPFTRNTKAYFRRRLPRTLRKIGKFQAEDYSRYATAVLLQVDDKDVRSVYSKRHKLRYFPHLSAVNFILHRHSRLLTKNHLSFWHLKRGIKQDIAHPEAYPLLWKQAAPDLFALLLDCKARIINDFSFQRLNQSEDYLTTRAIQDWVVLVQKPYENTALLAVDYLNDVLTQPTVLKAVLSAQFKAVRKRALENLDGESLGTQIDVLAMMLLSEYSNVHRFAKSYLYTAQAHYTVLSDRILATLLTRKTVELMLTPRVEWVLLHPLKNHASLSAIAPLLKHPNLTLQLLGSKLLAVSKANFYTLEVHYQNMSQSEHPEIRAGALGLLTRLSVDEKIQYKSLLFNALVDEHPALRERSHRVIKTIKRQAFRKETFDFVLPTFFKTEPVEGFADDMLALVLTLKPIYKKIDINLLWRLLHAKSKLAEWVGALILPMRSPKEFSVKQLVFLTKHATQGVRNWSFSVFEQDLSLVVDHSPQSIGLLDNPWDDTRQQAIQFFQNQFNHHFWDGERTLAVCDNVYADVQRFGRDLVTRFFQKYHSEAYLLYLSQHPSPNVQQFISSFLSHYANDKPDLILSLQHYFRTVLSQVNRGRIVKDRIIQFLLIEARKNEAVATMVATLFSEQSISHVIVDRMQYIQTLFKIQNQFRHIKTAIKVIEPEIRGI
ncbi:MAG: hypothetical protein KAG28_05400 [Cocleimonas sp.]|nr:hypothetical protein [Cocleimonas sp.]